MSTVAEGSTVAAPSRPPAIAAPMPFHGMKLNILPGGRIMYAHTR